MKSIAIIPARGGSKRIPRKNIIEFCGKPMISFSIQLAIESGLFDTIMVSTDDDEIAKIATSYGASVPFIRSSVNSDDFATTSDVLLEVLDSYHALGLNFDCACCIYPTAPLIRPESLLRGFELMRTKEYQSVFPVVAFSYPVWRSLKMNDDHLVSMEWPEYYNSRSQDLTKLYHDAGQWYWLNCYELQLQKKLYMDKSYGLELEETEVQDIDNEVDLKLAELKYKLLYPAL